MLYRKFIYYLKHTTDTEHTKTLVALFLQSHISPYSSSSIHWFYWKSWEIIKIFHWSARSYLEKIDYWFVRNCKHSYNIFNILFVCFFDCDKGLRNFHISQLNYMLLQKIIISNILYDDIMVQWSINCARSCLGRVRATRDRAGIRENDDEIVFLLSLTALCKTNISRALFYMHTKSTLFGNFFSVFFGFRWSTPSLRKRFREHKAQICDNS